MRITNETTLMPGYLSGSLQLPRLLSVEVKVALFSRLRHGRSNANGNLTSKQLKKSSPDQILPYRLPGLARPQLRMRSNPVPLHFVVYEISEA